MSEPLEDVIRGFVNRTVSRDAVHQAAMRESVERQLANETLKVLTVWENSNWTDDELRARLRNLIEG